MTTPAPRVLFVSNGHGEDLNGSLVLSALRHIDASIELAALPIVGEGHAYRRLGVRVIGRTKVMPSGGIIYTNRLNLLRDLGAGLIQLSYHQWKAARAWGRTGDLVFATGDHVAVGTAWLTGRPYLAFLTSSSSYYTGRIRLPHIMRRLLGSRRCLQVFARDRYTAEDLLAHGVGRAVFSGLPIMDVLTPAGRDLELAPGPPMIALLPGSRLPEATNNLAVELACCHALASVSAPGAYQFRAAIVPDQNDEALARAANLAGWHYAGRGRLVHPRQPIIEVVCHTDAFADILQRCSLAIGMAGTAVEQAVGLGKPVIQLVGDGPQFTWRFAEAQMRLLGCSVQTFGRSRPDHATLHNAAARVPRILADTAYLDACRRNGRERNGKTGGSAAIAACVAAHVKLGTAARAGSLWSAAGHGRSR